MKNAIKTLLISKKFLINNQNSLKSSTSHRLERKQVMEKVLFQLTRQISTLEFK
jgi:hypothetical protein